MSKKCGYYVGIGLACILIGAVFAVVSNALIEFYMVISGRAGG